jgi:class 3 adenylate cyclase
MERQLLDGQPEAGTVWLTATGAEQAEKLEESTSLRHGEDVVRVILFTDVVGSTKLTETIGDEEFRRRAGALDASVRAVVRNAGGAPIEGKRLGDGLLAVFTSGRAAIDAAIACRRVAEEQALELHIGLHAADIVYQGTDITGGGVNLAARICEQSFPNEILVSDVVRGLVRTSSRATFGEPRLVSLKGIEGEQRVFPIEDLSS